jgi:hypothetical protein
MIKMLSAENMQVSYHIEGIKGLIYLLAGVTGGIQGAFNSFI